MTNVKTLKGRVATFRSVVERFQHYSYHGDSPECRQTGDSLLKQLFNMTHDFPELTIHQLLRQDLEFLDADSVKEP